MAAIMMRNNAKCETKRSEKASLQLHHQLQNMPQRAPIISQWVLVKYWGVDKLWQRLCPDHVLHVNQPNRAAPRRSGIHSHSDIPQYIRLVASL